MTEMMEPLQEEDETTLGASEFDDDNTQEDSSLVVDAASTVQPEITQDDQQSVENANSREASSILRRSSAVDHDDEDATELSTAQSTRTGRDDDKAAASPPTPASVPLPLIYEEESVFAKATKPKPPTHPRNRDKGSAVTAATHSAGSRPHDKTTDLVQDTTSTEVLLSRQTNDPVRNLPSSTASSLPNDQNEPAKTTAAPTTTTTTPVSRNGGRDIGLYEVSGLRLVKVVDLNDPAAMQSLSDPHREIVDQLLVKEHFVDFVI